MKLSIDRPWGTDVPPTTDSRPTRCLRSLTRRLRGEAGFAVPTVLFAILAAFAIASAGAITTIRAQDGVVRDQDTKAALAAADAGAQQALLRYNLIAPTTASPCLVPGPGGVMVQSAPAADGWCPAVSGSSGSDAYVYRTRSLGGQTLEIVSTGTSDGVSRRIELATRSTTDAHVFSSAGVIGRESVSVHNHGKIHANVATNGGINISGGAEICGNASYGIGQSIGGGGGHYSADCSAAGTATEEPLPPLLPVSPGDVWNNNSNADFSNPGLIGGNPNGVSYNATTRTLTITNQSTLTLGGANYSLCKLVIEGNGATLFVAANATVRVYFHSPEQCIMPSGGTQMELGSKGRIVSTSGIPNSAAFLFVGSTNPMFPTKAYLHTSALVGDDCANDFIVYGPNTDIEMHNHSVFCGAVAGKTVYAHNHAEIRASPDIDDFILPGVASHYLLEHFAECTGASATPPDGGC